MQILGCHPRPSKNKFWGWDPVIYVLFNRLLGNSDAHSYLRTAVPDQFTKREDTDLVFKIEKGAEKSRIFIKRV